MDNHLPQAPCGLDCNSCALYRAAFDPESAASLVLWFKSRGWIAENGGAAEVTVKAPFCMGCMAKTGVRWSDDCVIRACCNCEKKLSSCGECPDFICEQLAKWGGDAPHHALAVDHLAKLREHGNVD